MSVDSTFTLAMIRLNSGTDVDLYGLTDVSISEGLQEVLAHGAGAVDPSFMSLLSIEPVISVTATELTKILAVFGNDGLCIGSAQTYTDVQFYFVQLGKCAPRLGSTNHIKVTMNEGLIIPTTLTASQGQTATLGLEFHASYDGTNAPLSFATSQALPATAAISQQFTLGPVKINGTELLGVQQTTVNWGINLAKEKGAGQVYPTFIGITQRQPSIEVRTKKLTSISTFGLTGTAQGATDSVIYFRKQSANGTLVADATSEHISVTIDDGIITVPTTGSQNNQTGDSTVKITPVYDGTNAIMAISSATAIS